MKKRGRGPTRFYGVSALASELGLSTTHVSEVLAGRRPGKDVMAAAKKKGIIQFSNRNRSVNSRKAS